MKHIHIFVRVIHSFSSFSTALSTRFCHLRRIYPQIEDEFYPGFPRFHPQKKALHPRFIHRKTGVIHSFKDFIHNRGMGMGEDESFSRKILWYTKFRGQGFPMNFVN
jgi:hypothetical protein